VSRGQRIRARSDRLLPFALGLSDGILNALILASAAVLHSSSGGLTIALAAKVAVVALLTSLFTVYVAEYAQLRSELVHAERELNLTSAGQLATTRLGRAVRREAAVAALTASAWSFVGSLAPLLLGSALPSASWLALALGVAALGALGLLIARAVYGDPLRWAVAMTIGGLVVTAVGVQLNIT
jgi:predicted membrane protein (TIGR00267 family)